MPIPKVGVTIVEPETNTDELVGVANQFRAPTPLAVNVVLLFVQIFKLPIGVMFDGVEGLEQTGKVLTIPS